MRHAARGMDRARRKQLFNACNPHESLAPDDPRNVALDELGGPDARPRGIPWAERLAEEITLSADAAFVLFTGLPGSGKSTELRRVAASLAGEARGRLLPVFVDAEQVIDLSNPIDVPDLIAPIVHTCERHVLDIEGKDPDGAGHEGYLARLWQWLTTTEVELGNSSLGVSGVAGLVSELRTRPSFRTQVRRIVATHLTDFLADAHRYLIQLEQRTLAQGYGGLVVVFDSLEKLRGIDANWDDVLQSAERLFAKGAPYLRLPVHVIYTIPAALVARSNVDVTVMPMVKIADTHGQPYEIGVAAMRAVIDRRMPVDAQREVFGETTESCIDQIIDKSGGYLRELVTMLRESMMVAEQPISEYEFQRILGARADHYQEIVTADAYEWLAEIAVNKRLVIRTESQRRLADRMLAENVVLRYQNRRLWFDLHPAVYSIPGVASAIAALRAGPQGVLWPNDAT